MEISNLDRCLIDLDIKNNPFLAELISSTNMKDPNSIKNLIEVAASVNYEVQLATVIKSVTKSVLITIKNTASAWPKIGQYISIIKPENINGSLTFEEHRAIIAHKRDRQSKLSPLFQKPYFLIAKNVLFGMIASDVSSLLNLNKSQEVKPVDKALEKIDQLFRTTPDSPIVLREFESVPVVPAFSPIYFDDLSVPTPGEEVIAEQSGNFTPTTNEIITEEPGDFPIAFTNQDILDFNSELLKIFPENSEYGDSVEEDSE